MSYTNEKTLALINARKIVNYISNLDTFRMIEVSTVPVYNHIGALYTDVILQSGLNYENVVKPRVKRILYTYPNAKTLSSFNALLKLHGTSLVLQWKHDEKIRRMHTLINFSETQKIESIEDLISYLSDSENHQRLMDLKGIGPKTLDYLMKLLGFDTIAVDRHIYKFVEMAGLPDLDYNNTKLSVCFAADLLEKSRKTLDYSIWKYMMNREYERSVNLQLPLEIV